MPRIRGVKPDFFKDEDLAILPFEARLLFEGLWCYADKKGRLEDRPKYLKAEIFPYDEVDIEKLLNLLANPKLPQRNKKIFIRRYSVNGRQYIDIPEFLKHQKPHHTEKDSLIPEFNSALTVKPRKKKEESVPCSLSLDTVKESVQEKDSVQPKAERATKGQLTDEEFIKALKDSRAYKGIDIDKELARMDVWLLTPKAKGRHKTRRFIVNWLNKCEGFGALPAQDAHKTQQNKQQADVEAKARAEAIKKARLILSERLKCAPQDVPIFEIEREINRGKSP